ncbi:uncharacterized protein LOC124787987 [Schistocerca piceifrons]|uniref:uncharacterized protein LOC124787987 n=1 Tax=Schistocerca piceifrons TaxID=274613 RepID=UPI001F5F790D|nr:uncharacterized protein LOC124787987 [Schistocerca piceifrons]
MVYKCCVPRCRGNYENKPRVAVFSFPKSTELQQKWISAIHRENFQVTQNSKVCELHFTEDLILKHSEYFDSSTGKKYSVPLPKPRLKTGAIPSILPNCPKYLSSASCSRESGDERRKRLENRDLEIAIAASVATHAQYEQERHFVDFNGFVKCLEGIKLPNDWHLIKSESSITFVLIDVKGIPTLLCSVVVTTDLSMYLYEGKSVISKLGTRKFPLTINHLNDLIK